ncbi:MAG: DUF4240 domain-containing protein [Micromonosporaceae bacterium]|nr:DUF4240 domain-containing protein [Micromonosporaceae bacterium]
MDIDRFWQLIDQARAAAGPQADQAVRDVDLPDDVVDEEQIQALIDAAWAEVSREREAGTAADLTDDPELLDAELVDGEDEEDDLTDPVAVALFKLLIQLPAAEIADFDNTFEDIRAQADTPEMVAAATLIEHGFFGADSFDDFRAGLVALGRATFEAAVANPDSLADHPAVKEIATAADPRWLGREDVLFVASYAYAEVTGEDPVTFFDFAESLREAPPPAGDATDEEEWEVLDEAQTRARLPRLSELFYERAARNRRRLLGRLNPTP